MKTLIAAFCVSTMLLSACSSSGIVPREDGIQTISKTSAAGVFGNTDGVKNDIYVEANEFCSKQGKVVQTVTVQTQEAVPGRSLGFARLAFRCIKSGPKESDQCIEKLADDPDLAGLRDKVSLSKVGDQTFSMLSDNSKPTVKEKELLKIWGNKRDVCIRLDRAEMQEARAPLPIANLKSSYLSAGQLLIADLMNGNLTYSSYAVKRQELSTFANDTVNKIQTELRKETQESRFRAEQLAIEAQRNELLNQKIQSDRSMQQQQIQSNERMNSQPVFTPSRSTTTNCRPNGNGVRCTTD